MERKSIGQFIAALRKANGLTQKQLADELNVSDKAVSRWERDETAPDISLIPVIADIFGVTCDELLCGERKINNENSSVSDEILSAKGEKQRRRLLAVASYQHRIRSLISIGISLVGIIAAAICNFAFYRGRLGFLISIIFLVAAGICQAIFSHKALLSVVADEFSDNETRNFKRQVVMTYELVCGFELSLEAFALPLIYATWDAYMGLDLAGWLINGLVCTLVTAIISYIICVAVNAKIAKRGTWEITEKDKIKNHNIVLFAKCAVSLAVVIFLTYGVYCAVTDDGYWPKFADGIIFEDYQSFSEFIEQDVPSPGMNSYSNDQSFYIEMEIESEDDEYVDPDVNSDEYYDMYIADYFDEEPYGIYDDSMRIVIKDIDGNTVVDCIRMNSSVVSIEYGNENDGFLPIKVVTADETIIGQQRLMYVKLAFLAVAILEAGAAICVYFKKREKLSK